MAEQLLLDPADAIADVERFRRQQDGAHIVVRQDPLGFDRALGRDDPVQGRLRLHDALGAAAGKVLLHEVGQFVVHQFELRLVDADDKGRQPEAGLPILLVEPDHAAPHQLEQALADLAGRQPGPRGDHVHRLEGAGQLAGQGGLLGREDLLQDAELHPRVGAGKAVGKPVEGRRRAARKRFRS